MVQTIGNPLSWSVNHASSASRTLGSALGHMGHGDISAGDLPQVRKLTRADLSVALRRGMADATATRSDVIFLVVLYPVIGLLLTWFAFDRNLLPLVFPLVTGFALVGPVAAVGLYEISRQREAGGTPGWSAAMAVTRAPGFGAILALGLMLGALFLVWILAAHGIYALTVGQLAPATIGEFVTATLTTGPGWAMILLGCGLGFLFAAAVLATSTFAFPMLIDRDIGLPAAVTTSLRVARANPGVVALWGLIVAALLLLGSLPFFLGLMVVLPILGHATWHLYRRAIAQ